MLVSYDRGRFTTVRLRILGPQGNDRVRVVTTVGMILTVAGDGNPGYAGDGGSAMLASFFKPRGLYLDDLKRLFVADAVRHVLRWARCAAVARLRNQHSQRSHSASCTPGCCRETIASAC